MKRRDLFEELKEGMAELEKRCTLLPVTNRYRQLIKAHGPLWVVVKRSSDCVWAGHAPCYYVRSLDGKHERWVLPEDISL